MPRYAERAGLARIRLKADSTVPGPDDGWKLFRVMAPEADDPDTRGCLCRLVQVSPPDRPPHHPDMPTDRLLVLYPGDVIVLHGDSAIIEEDEECEPDDG